jgi:hypothetical protein
MRERGQGGRANDEPEQAMSIEQLQQSIDGAAQAIDGRFARDAETIREQSATIGQLVDLLCYAYPNLKWANDHGLPCMDLIRRVDAAVAQQLK